MTPRAAARRWSDTAYRVARLAAVTHIRGSFAVVLSAGAVVLGAAMLARPEAFEVPTFELATRWIAPQGWGVMHIATGGGLLWAVAADRHSAHVPAGALALMWSAWAWLLTWDAADGSGVPSAAIIYNVVAILAGFCAAGYALTRDEEPR